MQACGNVTVILRCKFDALGLEGDEIVCICLYFVRMRTYISLLSIITFIGNLYLEK